MTSTELVIPTHRGATLPEKIEYAKHLAESGLLPAQYRKQPANILYAYEYGEMLGLAPLAAITGIHVIEGKPSASSALMSALVRRAGHRLRISGDDERAVAEITRADDPGFTFRSEWTIKRAKIAELTGKGTWKKYPAAMLKARAISECARDACEEALLGMHYTPEELGAEVDEDETPIRVVSTRVVEPTEDSTPEPDWNALIGQHADAADLSALGALWKQARQLRPDDPELRERIAAVAQRVKNAQQPTGDGDAEATEDAAEHDSAPSPDEVRRKKMNHLFAILGKGGIKDDSQRHEISRRVLQHPVDTWTTLTTEDIQILIDTLGPLVEQGPLNEVFLDLPEAGSA